MPFNIVVGLILAVTASNAVVASNACASSGIGPVRLPLNDTAYTTCYNGKLVSTVECPEDWVFEEQSQGCAPIDDDISWVPNATAPNASLANTLPSTVLYVWAGPDNPGPNCRDAVVVVNGDVNTAGFGQIINISYTPHWGSEPHHVGLSNNTFLGVGGFNGYLYGNPDIYIFNVSVPTAPALIAQVDPPLSAVTDSFAGQADGGFWVSQMGNATGGTPGRLVRLSGNFSVVREEPANPPPGFAPHGFVIHNATQRLITTDYVDYSSSVVQAQGVDKKFVGASGPNAKAKYGHVLRVWQLPNFTLAKEYDLGENTSAGLMSIQLIGNVAIATNGKGLMWGINVTNLDAPARPVHYISTTTNSCVFTVLGFSSGTRVFGTALGLNLVQLVDTTDPWNWKTIEEIYLPPGSQPHAIANTRNGTLLAVSTYYVNQKYNGTAIGTFREGGTKQVYFFEVYNNGNHLRYLPRKPVIDFQNDVNKFRNETVNAQCGKWRPHGIVFRAPTPAPPTTNTTAPSQAPAQGPAQGPAGLTVAG